MFLVKQPKAGFQGHVTNLTSYFNAVHMEDAKPAICLQVALNSNYLNLLGFLFHFHVRRLSLIR